MSEKFTVQPVIDWNEWVSLYRLFFGNSRLHNDTAAADEQVLNDDRNQVQCANTYLRDIVLQRSKSKNTLSLIYTQRFVEHYLAWFSIKAEYSTSLFQERTITKQQQSLQQVVDREEQQSSRSWQSDAIGLDIIRFTSQLTDLSQQNRNAQKHQSINQTLQNSNMREHEFIAEIRHSLTHKHKPSHFLLEKALLYILRFLRTNYWEVQYVTLNSAQNDPLNAYLPALLQQAEQENYLFTEDRVEKFTQLIMGNQNVVASAAIEITKKRSNKQIKEELKLDHSQAKQILRVVERILLKSQNQDQDQFARIFSEVLLPIFVQRQSLFNALVARVLRIALREFFYSQNRKNSQIRLKIAQNCTQLIKLLTQFQESSAMLTRARQAATVDFKLRRVASLLDYDTEVFQQVYEAFQNSQDESQTEVVKNSHNNTEEKDLKQNLPHSQTEEEQLIQQKFLPVEQVFPVAKIFMQQLGQK